MQRRKFILNTAKTGLLLSAPKPLFSAINAIQPKPLFKLSLAQWSLHKAIFNQTLSPLDFAMKAKQMGFEGIEYVNQLYDKEIKQNGFDNVIKALNDKSKTHNITNVLIMVDNEGELSAKSKTERDSAIANHKKWIEAANELGCHSIRVNLFGKDTEHDYKLWKEASVDGLGRLSEYGAKNKINVVVENHGGLSSDADKLTDVIQTIDSKYCGTLPDFGNFCAKREQGDRWGGACIEEYDRYKGVKKMMPFAKGVSAKSYAFDDNGNETTTDFFRMMKIVKKSGYSGFIGVEYEGENLAEEEGIISTKNLILKAIQKI